MTLVPRGISSSRFSQLDDVIPPVSVPVSELPEVGLVITESGPGNRAVHRHPAPQGCESSDFRPLCRAGRLTETLVSDGREVDVLRGWREVEVAEVIRFSRYSLCDAPLCFRGIEVEDG